MTKGLAGFYGIDEVGNYEFKLAYQNDNAEPNKLGLKILQDVTDFSLSHDKSIVNLNQIYCGIEAIDESYVFDPKCKQHLRRRLEEFEYNKNASTLYEAYVPLQGSIAPYLSGRLRVLPQATDFLHEGAICEWVYSFNTELNSFDIFRGRVLEPSLLDKTFEDLNLAYDYLEDDIYYVGQLMQRYSLSQLPSERQFLEDLANS